MARWRWWLHLLLIGAYPVAIGLLSLAASSAGTNTPALASTPGGLVLATLVELVFFSFVLGIGWLASRASVDAMLLRWRGGFRPLAWGLGYSVLLRFGIMIVVVIGAGVIIGLGFMSPDEFEAFAKGNNPDVGSLLDLDALRENPVYFWLMTTYVSFIFAGLREELWRAAVLAGFVALWPRAFASRGAQIGAVALAAIAFAIGHAPQGIIGATMAGVLGFGLGVIMIVHRSIWPAVIAHGCFDATTFVLLPWVADKLPGMQ